MAPGRSRQAPDQRELNGYYERRIADFEAERDDLLRRVDACSTQQSTLLELDRDHAQRSDEVVELQRALSNAHTFLYEERELLLELQAENDALQHYVQHTGSKSSAQHNAPQGQSNTFRSTVSGRFTKPGRRNGKSTSHADRQLLYTFSNEALWEQLQSLTDQLNDQKQFAAERAASMVEDRRIREAETEAFQAAAAERTAKLSCRIEHLEKALQETTKDYILARREKHEAAMETAQLRDELRQMKTQAGKDVREARQESEQKLAAAAVEHKRCMDDYASSFCKQMQEREAEVADLACELEQTRMDTDQQVYELRAALSRAQENVRQLEQRRALDMEGWANDVTLLRKQAAAVDRRMHQMRIVDRLEDDERRDAILDTLTLRAPDPDPSAVTQLAAPDTPAHSMTKTKAKTIPSGTIHHDISIVDDGIARLAAMLRQKERNFSPSMRVVGNTMDSPRLKGTHRAKSSVDGSASLHAEPTLRT